MSQLKIKRAIGTKLLAEKQMQKTEGGLYLPQTNNSLQNHYLVIEAGEQCKTESGLMLKKGEVFVTYEKGVDIFLEGKGYFLFDYRQVHLVLENKENE